MATSSKGYRSKVVQTYKGRKIETIIRLDEKMDVLYGGVSLLEGVVPAVHEEGQAAAKAAIDRYKTKYPLEQGTMD